MMFGRQRSGHLDCCEMCDVVVVIVVAGCGNSR
jgi:hypothetical protein